MFGNENDRPYELKVDTASTATMAYVIGRLRDEITVPFGVNVLWDPMAAWPSPPPPARPSCARSSPAPMPATWGRGRPMPGPRCAIAPASGAAIWRMLYNVSAEFADSLDRRSLPDRARSAVFSSIPDAVLVSGQITGEAAAHEDLEAVKRVLPDTPVLANTGRQACHRRRCAARGRRLHRRLGAEGRTATPGTPSIPTAPPTSWRASAPRGAAT